MFFQVVFYCDRLLISGLSIVRRGFLFVVISLCSVLMFYGFVFVRSLVYAYECFEIDCDGLFKYLFLGFDGYLFFLIVCLYFYCLWFGFVSYSKRELV